MGTDVYVYLHNDDAPESSIDVGHAPPLPSLDVDLDLGPTVTSGMFSLYFYALGSNDQGHIVFYPVCLFVCLSVCCQL